MENITETYKKSDRSNNANETSHYVLLTVGIFIGIVGTLLRFIGTWTFVDLVSDIIFIIGAIVCFKAVFDILK
ncbi:hypothetical protein [Rubrolithibacter danxiaensis]|uniref:hypothetical protein n=1 Tax=Rubrolithibacter danxiaensis TaxID=3390805 RepID=UPI003BF7C016